MGPRKKISPIELILIPTDFTVCSDRAIEYGQMIAGKFGARILLMHVIEPLTYSVTDMIQVVDHYMALKTIAEPMMENLKKKISKGDLKVKTFVIKGSPYLEIVKKTRKSRVDLIVMGTHGHTGVKHLMMGSVAERVVRMSPAPVLTVQG